MPKRRRTIVRRLAVVAAAFVAGTGAHAQTPGVMSVPDAHAYYVCKTRVSFSPGHGTQVSYMNAAGAVFLWYPGNAIVLPGRWRIEEVTVANQPHAALCFQYGANTYNPVTKERGATWNCLPAHFWARTTVDSAEGDVFGLTRRSAVPFRLSPERTTIADLQKNVRPQNPRRPDPGCPTHVAGLAPDGDWEHRAPRGLAESPQ
jgi:hypothetical protein